MGSLSPFLLLLAALELPLPAQNRPLRVLTSIPPLYCFAANVGRDSIHLENLLPPHVEPHDFQLSRRELAKLNSADLVLLNGLGLESWLDKLLTAPDLAKKVIRVGEVIGPGSIPARDGPGQNPHFWLDPTLAAEAVRVIAAELGRRDPSRRELFQRQAELYRERLSALDASLQTQLSVCQNRNLLTFHDAFPYWARHFNFKVVGVFEETPEIDPSARHLTRLRQLLREKDIRFLFVEPDSATRLLQQFLRDHPLRAVELDPMETAPLDLGAYEQIMKQNAAALARCLSR